MAIHKKVKLKNIKVYSGSGRLKDCFGKAIAPSDFEQLAPESLILGQVTVIFYYSN